MEFNVGDKVWLVDVYGEITDGESIAIVCDVITDIYVDENDPSDEPLYATEGGISFWDSLIGERVFRTKEEAEARVKGLESYLS